MVPGLSTVLSLFISWNQTIWLGLFNVKHTGPLPLSYRLLASYVVSISDQFQSARHLGHASFTRVETGLLVSPFSRTWSGFSFVRFIGRKKAVLLLASDCGPILYWQYQVPHEWFRWTTNSRGVKRSLFLFLHLNPDATPQVEKCSIQSLISDAPTCMFNCPKLNSSISGL